MSGRALTINSRAVATRGILVTINNGPIGPSVPNVRRTVASSSVFRLPRRPGQIMVLNNNCVNDRFTYVLGNLNARMVRIIQNSGVLHNFSSRLHARVRATVRRHNVAIVANYGLATVRGAPSKMAIALAATRRRRRVLISTIDLTTAKQQPGVRQLNLRGANISVRRRNTVAISRRRHAAIPRVFTINSIASHTGLAPITVGRNHVFTSARFNRGPNLVDRSVVPATIFAAPRLDAINLARRRTGTRFNRDSIRVFHSHFQPVCCAVPGLRTHALVGLIMRGSASGILKTRVMNSCTTRVVRNITVTIGVKTAGTGFSTAITVRPDSTRRFIAVQ